MSRSETNEILRIYMTGADVLATRRSVEVTPPGDPFSDAEPTYKTDERRYG